MSKSKKVAYRKNGIYNPYPSPALVISCCNTITNDCKYIRDSIAKIKKLSHDKGVLPSNYILLRDVEAEIRKITGVINVVECSLHKQRQKVSNSDRGS